MRRRSRVVGGGFNSRSNLTFPEYLPDVHDRQHFDRFGKYAIDQTVRWLDQFSDSGPVELRNAATGFRMNASLLESPHETVDELFGIHRG